MSSEKIKTIAKEGQMTERVKNTIKELIRGYGFYTTPEFIEKIAKFDKIANFIPCLRIIEMYPEEQIEKFNKKYGFK